MTPPAHLLLSGLIALSFVAGAAAARAQEPAGDDELGRHLAATRERLDDPSIEPAVREEMALETAATLDRAARSALDLDTRLARWDAAVALLDEFDRKNMDHRRRREFGLQAAVYRWAQARALHDRRAMRPAQAGPPERESAALDDAISRLRMIVGGEAGSLSDNVRFRLAWALADRAALEASGSPTAAMRREEALDLLKDPPAEPSLSGFQSLLKARLLRESGKLDLAYFQVDESTRSASPPPEAEVLDVLVPILIDQGRFEDAAGKVESSGLSSPAKALHKLRIDLTARRAAPAGDEGRERRRTIEADILKQIGTLREAKAPEIRVALAELAEAIPELDDNAPSGLLGALSEGLELRDNPAGAAATAGRAAARADLEGDAPAAAAFRLRAGGLLFQEGRYGEADATLGRVIDDPKAGPSRPKAGLLQALARSRMQQAGGDAQAFGQALERQIREFPGDPTADEARYLLGSLRAASGRRDEALALWKQVSADSPRWAASRVAACESDRRALEARIAAEEREGLSPLYDEASAILNESLETARSRPEADRAELLLARARLNLVPIVGQPAVAREAAEECMSLKITEAVRYRAKLVRLFATALLGRYLEAEREAQQHANWAAPAERPALMEALRQIDLAASAAETDLLQRRLGLIARILIQPTLKDESLSDDERNELTFRLARALLFQGDPQSAQAALRGWAPSTRKADDRYLKDLADTYFRMDANELAIDVERLRIKNLAAGTDAWFDARYGLALAYYRLGRKQDARQLIEGTAILHPELGGGRIREKFIRLRQRLGSAP